MSYTILDIFNNRVKLRCNVSQRIFEYDIQFILTSSNQPASIYSLLIGDILEIDHMNYMHMVQYSSNRIYDSATYLYSIFPKPWFCSYFPYIRPFTGSSSNFMLVFGTKILEYTFLHNTQELVNKVNEIAPEMREILNYFMAKNNSETYYKVMSQILSQPEHVISITEHCLHNLKNDIKTLASSFNIKLTIIVMPDYNINIINPQGEIEFTLLFKNNIYEILYTEKEKHLMQAPGSLKFLNSFNSTEHSGFNIEEMKEKHQKSVKNFELSQKIFKKLFEKFIFSDSNRIQDVVDRLGRSCLYTDEIRVLVESVLCKVCKRNKKILELECGEKVCENCFVEAIGKVTGGLFVMNPCEIQVKYSCPACFGPISIEFIKKNLPNYSKYAEDAFNRMDFTCKICDVQGKINEFLTECRHTCRYCTINNIRAGELDCEDCKTPYSKEIYAEFMNLTEVCEGCNKVFNWIKGFEKKFCSHLLCLECLEDCKEQVCYEKCPKFNLSNAEYKNLFLVKCQKCPESSANIFPRIISYWNKKNCQCKICIRCMFSDTYNLYEFNCCPICNISFSEEFSAFLRKEYEEKLMNENNKFLCKICNEEFIKGDFISFMNCTDEMCKNCFGNHIKYLLSDINLISGISKCAFCSEEITPGELEAHLSPEDWDKFNYFNLQKTIKDMTKCPRCEEMFDAGISRRVICPNKDCNLEFCKQCKEAFHKDGDCEENFIQGRIELLKNEDGGVTQCPKCRLPYIKDPKNCEHATCINTSCGVEFCFLCACIRSPTIEHANHYHRPICKFFAPYDGKDDVFKEKCTECVKLGSLCKPPKDLKVPRLVSKDEAVN